MGDIKVGEYVRTKKGSIGKFKFYETEEKIVYFKGTCGTTCVDENDIVKHSKNIIDLIELGDYVNGHLVINIQIDKNNKIVIITENKHFNKYYENGIAEIKSILTHELFESIKYEV